MENTIYNDDCFNVFDKIENKKIDLVLVDLPYGQTACDWDVCIDLKEMWNSLKRICKDKCQFVFFTTTRFGYKLIESNPKWFRYDLVWEKFNAIGFLSANKMPLRSHEMIYIFSKSPKPKGTKQTYNPQKTLGKPWKSKEHKTKKDVYGQEDMPAKENTTGDRHPRSVIKFHQSGKKIHPTQKPVDLCEWLIKTYSNEGDLVLDFCMGSGTTIEASINTNRKYIGIEKDEDIFEIAKNRLNF
jgi:site-specific DNA-methyltransferase (adenine-specific)